MHFHQEMSSIYQVFIEVEVISLTTQLFHIFHLEQLRQNQLVKLNTSMLLNIVQLLIVHQTRGISLLYNISDKKKTVHSKNQYRL